METRANYVLIGAFTLFGLAAIVLGFLWFARIELDRQFGYYDVRFESVAGLSEAADVRFAGLPVGQVADIRLAPERDGTVVVRLEVDAATPVRTTSEATVESQGVTGVSYVGISAGDPDTPLLDEAADSDVPTIPAGTSVFQSLTQDAPELLQETLDTVRNINDVLSPDNRARVDNILINVEAASDDFSDVLSGFSDVTEQISNFAREVDRFNTTLENLSDDVSVVLRTADETLVNIGDLALDGQSLLERGEVTLNSTIRTIESANGYLSNDLPALTIELQGAVADLRRETLDLTDRADATLANFDAAARSALDRFAEAEPLIDDTLELVANLDIATTHIDEAATYFDDLMEGDFTAVIVESRAALQDVVAAVDEVSALARQGRGFLEATEGTVAAATGTLQGAETLLMQDLPALTDDLRGSIADLGDRLDRLTARAESALAALEGAGTSATARLDQAEPVIAETEALVAQLRSTAEGVDRAVASVDGLVSGEGAALVSEARALVTDAAGAVRTVSRVAEEDLPTIVSDIRTATARATEVIETVGADLQDATGRIDGLSEEAQTALEVATATFANANTTFGAVNSALASGEQTLAVVEETFAKAGPVLDGANRVINEDISTITADLREAIGTLNAAVAQVSEDIPEVSGDVRDAAAQAQALFREIRTLVDETGQPLSAFAGEGLPQYTRLASETRQLIRNLDRLTEQIARDPARFLLDRDTPTFRR
ncbi:MCE family protein [Roseivivax sediminis]|uniref:Phospholipid/cholesterol/gamma-HCH transport system substrate-binding protein n=1 Tax=Roseivivax sediminis TaxID=936889 RepID=A0A1I1TJH1_9RHOB|nr:MlaD family protein [Roseivivax sediminis]SFD56553.1 phospholipid/cholesterol/gamma-HCH transport system substrate-binding protein [Roseivivax sediminis]